MNEFCLFTRNEVQERARRTLARPSGSVIVAISMAMKRRKWMEILADLADPRPRRNQNGRVLPSKRSTHEAGLKLVMGEARWKLVCERWSPALWDRWHTLMRIQEDEQHLKEVGMELFWQDEVERVSGFRDVMGRDETNTADLLDTWLWTPRGKREAFIVANVDMDGKEAEALQGWVDVDVRSQRFTLPAARLPWEDVLGLTQLERDRIRSRNYVIHPRYDRPVSRALFESAAQMAGRL